VLKSVSNGYPRRNVSDLPEANRVCSDRCDQLTAQHDCYSRPVERKLPPAKKQRKSNAIQTSFKEEGEEVALPPLQLRTIDADLTERAWNICGKAKWQRGQILNMSGPLSYQVQVGIDVWKRHCDQLRNRSAAGADESHRQGVCVEMSPDDPHLWVNSNVDTPAVTVGTVRSRPSQPPRQPLNLRDVCPLRYKYGCLEDPDGP